jgi:cytochrome c55X
MDRRAMRLRHIAIAAVATWSLVPGGSVAVAAGEAPGPERRHEIRHMVRHECGACHGLRLKGGLGPALTAKRLADRPAGGLVEAILDGREGTPMPPWRPFIEPHEARWLVQQLKTGDWHAE